MYLVLHCCLAVTSLSHWDISYFPPASPSGCGLWGLGATPYLLLCRLAVTSLPSWENSYLPTASLSGYSSFGPRSNTDCVVALPMALMTPALPGVFLLPILQPPG